MKNKVLTDHYDLYGNGIWRTMKLSLFGKFIPIGNLYGGPGARCLLVLAVLHWFGKPVYAFNAKHGDFLRAIKRRVKKSA